MNVTLEKYRENLFEVNNRHIFMVVQIVIISLDFVRFDRGTNEMCALWVPFDMQTFWKRQPGIDCNTYSSLVYTLNTFN